MAESSSKYSLLSSRNRLFMEQAQTANHLPTTGHSTTKPDITMPTAPLAVWVIRTIGLTNLITQTEKTLGMNDLGTVARLKTDKSLTVVDLEWSVYRIIIPAVTKITSTYLNDEAAGARVARVLAGLLVPKFLLRQSA